MVLKVFPDKKSLGMAAATQAATAIRHAIRDHGTARVVAATAASQSEFLDAAQRLLVKWAMFQQVTPVSQR
jgi:glucosamine-6-phosphate deaminase